MPKKIYILLGTLAPFLAIYTFFHKFCLELIKKLPPSITLLLLLFLSVCLIWSIELSCFFKRKQNKTYKIYCRFEGLVNIIKQHDINDPKYPVTRSKPWFNNYDSCIKEFKNLYKEEFEKLNLEPLPLYSQKDEELFTNDKRQTLLHQSEQIVAFLKGLLPPEYKKISNN